MGIRVVFTLFSVVALMVIFGMNQDAYAMTIIVDDDPPANPLRCSNASVICADNFELTSGATINDIHFWIVENNVSFDNNVGWSIYSDVGGVLQTPPIASGVGVNVMVMPFVAGGQCDGTFGECFEVWIDLDNPVPLSPGSYWLGIENTNMPWQILFDGGVLGNFFVSFDDGNNFVQFFGSEMPFILTSKFAVGGEISPVTTSALLLAGGQNMMSLMIPVLVSGIGIAIVIARKF